MNNPTREKPYVFKIVNVMDNTIDTWVFDTQEPCKLAINMWRKTALRPFREKRVQSTLLGFCYKVSQEDLNIIEYYFETSFNR